MPPLQVCKSVPECHTSYEEVCTQEYDTVCEDNDVKQKWKRSAQDDKFIKEVKATVGHSKGFMHPYLAKKLGADKVLAKRIVRGKVITGPYSEVKTNKQKLRMSVRLNTPRSQA